MNRLTIDRNPLTGGHFRNENAKSMRFRWSGHTPHWERPRGDHVKSWAELEVNANREHCYLSLYATESGEKSQKKTMLTVSTREAVRELRDICNFALGEQDRAQELADAARNLLALIGAQDPTDNRHAQEIGRAIEALTHTLAPFPTKG
jgi:hypothetical protein